MNKLISQSIRSFGQLRQFFALRRAQRRDRDAFMQLVWQEDRTLTDAGYSRDDINWAVNLPLSQNAALALKERVASRDQATIHQRPALVAARRPGPLAVVRHCC